MSKLVPVFCIGVTCSNVTHSNVTHCQIERQRDQCISIRTVDLFDRIRSYKYNFFYVGFGTASLSIFMRWEQLSVWYYPGGVLPYMGYIGMCGPKGYGFSVVLVINWVSILAILPPFWS